MNKKHVLLVFLSAMLVLVFSVLSVSAIPDDIDQIVVGDWVLLESHNYPGYYIRHINFDLVLNEPDGTTIFISRQPNIKC